jgi:hypothetical protein
VKPNAEVTCHLHRAIHVLTPSFSPLPEAGRGGRARLRTYNESRISLTLLLAAAACLVGTVLAARTARARRRQMRPRQSRRTRRRSASHGLL